MTKKLRVVSPEILDQLRDSVEKNLERYISGDFEDVATENGWNIDVDLSFDEDILAELDGKNETPEVAVSNSMIVSQAFLGLAPNLAAEERVWTRLCHLECLKYARERWLSGISEKQKQVDSIKKHFFAGGVPGIRDDNAISRLWWNAQIARQAMPSDQHNALKLILKTTDYRSNFVERRLMSSRPAVGGGILRTLNKEKWLQESQDNFRAFMVTLNRLGGGRLFEVMGEAAVDDFMQRCVAVAQGLSV